MKSPFNSSEEKTAWDRCATAVLAAWVGMSPTGENAAQGVDYSAKIADLFLEARAKRFGSVGVDSAERVRDTQERLNRRAENAGTDPMRAPETEDDRAGR